MQIAFDSARDLIKIPITILQMTILQKRHNGHSVTIPHYLLKTLLGYVPMHVSFYSM